MPPKNKRVILDTNLWISFLLTRDLEKFDELLFSNRIELTFSQELLEEFVEVSGRSKFKKLISKIDIELILDRLQAYADFIKVTSDITLCRDVKDSFLLSLAVDGKADFLVTGDKDLLVLKEVQETKIVSIRSFFDQIK